MSRDRVDTRTVGLEVACALAKWLTGKEHLHYGLWSGLEATAENVGPAQDAYVARLLSLLPQQKGLRILDIGGGAGETAAHLIKLGHRVEVVVPSAYLAGRCRENAALAVVHQATFEDVEVQGAFDVCLFAESLQYIHLDQALGKAKGLLVPGGVIVIGDCFRNPDGNHLHKSVRPPGGGHAIERFRHALRCEGLRIETEVDVTEAVAPSIDVEQAFFNLFGVALSGLDRELTLKRPWLRYLGVQLLSTLMGKRRLDKAARRVIGRDRTANAFRQSNCYLFLRLAPVE
ncbi:MAG: class I SAM-dependent methyltransferase [Pseudotabrizicola sp.]|uniref:class I SAM-dependent methyltransferase n=1 Tax=Pseudotabrizicola sp. TaxID=2939647 RepID=UPI00272F94F9|nr:class I SAM-dependent methyltransferase [Pseudotabrizicola sp.]MDP2079476.1 class I SAM-dependent methyltransferase [Pseudotabrizicola sp.]MDZ7576355.1 class I SAM-dependent methyltransferase [Pseudotabrizicola sp.]